MNSNFVAAQEDRELQMAIEASKREVSMRSDLPSGWEEKRDPSTGKYFYIDHVNKRTQWDKPKVLPDPSMPPAYDDCVPSTSKPETNHEQNTDVSSFFYFIKCYVRGYLFKELINFGERIPPAGTYPSQLNPFSQ